MEYVKIFCEYYAIIIFIQILDWASLTQVFWFLDINIVLTSHIVIGFYILYHVVC